MADARADARGPGPDHHRHVVELRREASTMGLYVAICLLTYLATLTGEHGAPPHLLGNIWGITIGLAVAHWFAFRVATRLARDGRFHRADVELAAAQLAGAIGVALLTSVPIALSPQAYEVEVAAFFLALLVASAGFLAIWDSGGEWTRSLLYAVVVLVAAAVVVTLKSWLSGH